MQYIVYVFCNECLDLHQLGRPIELTDGPSTIMSVQANYLNRVIPRHLMLRIERFAYCDRKQCASTQKNLSRIYLAPAIRR
jgi:hypothetical protein